MDRPRDPIPERPMPRRVPPSGRKPSTGPTDILAPTQPTDVIGYSGRPGPGDLGPRDLPPGHPRYPGDGRPVPGRPPRSLAAALGITAASALLPGAGHLLLRRRAGVYLVSAVALLVGAGVAAVLLLPRSTLLESLLSTRVLRLLIMGCVIGAVAWVAVVVRTYQLAKPRRLRTGQRLLGVLLVTALCVAVVAPFGLAAALTNEHRDLLDTLFPSDTAGALSQPTVNVLLVGSDAGPDRIGTRADTLVVANIDTRTGRTVLFGLPRNLGYAQFPPESAIAEEFPDGFHDPSNPSSPDYLLNAVYTYGNEHPDLAPPEPSADPGLNLLMSSVSYMLGLDIDYYVQVNMQGFASIIDALGGLDVDVGPKRIPMGGIGLYGEAVRPFGYIEPGRQHLNGDQALWFARSRTNSTDYARMGRQRCLIQFLVEQKSPADVLSNFRSVAIATTSNVDTNVPQNVLPALAKLADKPQGRALESLSFDPNLPDPNEPSGFFNTGRADVDYMREVVRNVLDPGSVAAPAPAPTTTRSTPARSQPGTGPSTRPPSPGTGAGTAETTSLADTCHALATGDESASETTSAPPPARPTSRPR